MDKGFLAAGSATLWALTVLPAAALAQGEPAATPPATGASCYVEVSKLMADPPAGIGELGAAIRELDVKLRPQVEEVNALKAQIARIEQRQAEATTRTEDASFEGEGRAQLPVVTRDPDAEELQRLQAERGGLPAVIDVTVDAVPQRGAA